MNTFQISITASTSTAEPTEMARSRAGIATVSKMICAAGNFGFKVYYGDGTRLDVLRATRSLVFCQGVLSVDGAPVLRTSGIARPSGEPDPEATLEHWLPEAAG